MNDLAFYNELDPYAAEWLRNLIDAGLIMPGTVDERSIEDLTPYDLLGYTQVHFFAGIGIWSLALRNAGWPDSRPVWTGSCPCQPFSTAGKGAGFADERHLWPAFFELIGQCKPLDVFGEQVSSKDADSWIDLVQDDMEGMGYAFGAVPFPSCSVGGPHKRDRLYWVAHSDSPKGERFGEYVRQSVPIKESTGLSAGNSSGSLADPRQLPPGRKSRPGEKENGRSRGIDCGYGKAGRLEHSDMPEQHKRSSVGEQSFHIERERESSGLEYPESEQERVSRFARQYGATRGYWAAADWIPCRDGYWRPVQPGTFPLAHGVTNRMGKIRAYGNAINAIQAQTFIESYLNV